jgi:hypothetical protein
MLQCKRALHYRIGGENKASKIALIDAAVLKIDSILVRVFALHGSIARWTWDVGAIG